jgi:hypothetical protein
MREKDTGPCSRTKPPAEEQFVLMEAYPALRKVEDEGVFSERLMFSPPYPETC